MYAHYIDVGQADCALLEFPCGAILIDVGTQDADHTQRLIEYLDDFFDDRPSLNRTLSAVFITHNHIDHTRALTTLLKQREATDPDDRIFVTRVFDNGLREGTGAAPIRSLASAIEAGSTDVDLRSISDSAITDLNTPTGLTDGEIDPLRCDACDPVIRILSGGLDADPGWQTGAFENHNNHSLVIRIDFGNAKFLFTGDLEEPAIETLVDYYDGTSMLDIDVYQVGHHGSHNGTTQSLLDAMSPNAAVISMGHWNFGRKSDGTARPFTTFAYGHPRKPILDLLQGAISGRRSTSMTIMAAEGARRFEEYVVRRRVYATGWDGTVKVRATTDGQFEVRTQPND